jgi:hypothetical protein
VLLKFRVEGGGGKNGDATETSEPFMRAFEVETLHENGNVQGDQKVSVHLMITTESYK